MQHNTPFVEYQTLFAPHTRGEWQIQYRGPNLLVSTEGTVVAFPSEKVGRISDEAKSNLSLRRSADHGRTWGELDTLLASENPRVRYSYRSGVVDYEIGRVYVFVGAGVVILPEDIEGAWPERWVVEHPEQAAVLRRALAPGVEQGLYLMWSDDEGETWSDLRPLGDSLHVIHPLTGERRSFGPQWVGVQLRYGPHAGRLVVPGRGWVRDRPFDLSAYSHNYVAYSDDHGESWRAGGLAQTGTGEACLVECADGTLYLNSRNESLRARGYRAWDRSYDGGQTFVESGYDRALPEPHCQASMVRYSGPPERSRVLFCNPAVHSGTLTHYDGEARRRLTVRLSTDECRTWPVGRLVCEGGAGYSALAVAKDGSILCAYETLGDVDGRWHYTGEIHLARFNLAWLEDEAGRQ
jgi:sialidase-1